MTTKPDYTSPLDATHASLIEWYVSEGNTYPPDGGCDAIRATMEPPTDHTPALPSKPAPPPSPVLDGRVWVRHEALAKLAGIPESRLTDHRNQYHIPLTGVRCKDPHTGERGNKWFYVQEVVDVYLTWLADAPARKAAALAQSIETRRKMRGH